MSASGTLPPSGGEGRVGGEAERLLSDRSELTTLQQALRARPPSPALPPSRGKGDHCYTRHAGSLAKRLRKELTFSEKALWAELRKLPLHVRKQSPIGRYVADFVIQAAKVVVEVDGRRHQLPEAQAHDAERDRFLAAEGYLIIRFTDDRAISDPIDCAQDVLTACLLRKGD